MTTDRLIHGPDLERRMTTPQLLLIGIDHHTAAIELREKVSYAEEETRELLGRLMADDSVAEASLLSTCNRTELYILPHDEASAYQLGLQATFLEKAPEIESEGRFFVKRDQAAAAHLFEVASGLQSMVLGEPEILGQVKRAAFWGEKYRASGEVLTRLYRAAISAGGRVRGETGIGSGAISFGYAVVDLARNIFRNLENLTVLMVGAGETAHLVARNLKERGAKNLIVTNRSRGRAEAFQEAFPDAEILPFTHRRMVLERCDVVVASTSADAPILHREDFEKALDHRRARPLLVADLGVPRNIDPAAGKLENLFLQDIDSLEGLVNYNLERRRSEVPRVQKILERELARYAQWYRGRAAEPVIADMQRQAEAIRRQVVDHVRDTFPEENQETLDRLTRALVKKLLHNPCVRLRARGRDEDLELVRDLFNLDRGDP